MEGNLQSFSLHNGGLQFLLKCIYNTDGIDDNNSPNFHRELLQYFQEIKNKTGIFLYGNFLLWKNEAIPIEKKMLFWKSWFNNRIDFIQDILRSDGDVFQLIAAIPSELKKKAISAEVPSHEQLLNSTTVSCHWKVHPYIDLANMRCKHYYKMLNKNSTLEPTGIKT